MGQRRHAAEETASDDELVRGVRAGDRASYRRLVDRHAPMIFRLVRRFVADAAEGEDLAQEIFIKAYERLDRFAVGTNFAAWLYTIGINHCRDYAKNIRRTVDPMSRVEAGRYVEAMQTSASQDREVEHAESAERLRWALDQLSSDYATAFLLKYEEGLPYQEMAAMLDTTVGALKVRVHRARKELQRLLQKKL